jgi:hypothetical protein
VAILTTFEFHGDPDQLVARMDELLGPDAIRASARNGCISSTVVKTEAGIMVINLWESEEGSCKNSEKIGPPGGEPGFGEQVGWRQFEVLRHRTPGD